jgi:hypothetical protein
LLLLWGDSHADHLAPMVRTLAAAGGSTLWQRSMSSCPPILEAVPRTSAGAINGCDVFNAAVSEEVQRESARRRVTVILAAFWSAYLGEARLDASDRRISLIDAGARTPAEAVAYLETHLRSTLADLDEHGVRIVIVGPIPEMRYDVPRCLAHRLPVECAVDRRTIEARSAAANRVLRSAALGLHDVRHWDLVPYLCDEDSCPAQRGNTVLYRDNHHLTAAAAADLATSAAALD